MAELGHDVLGVDVDAGRLRFISSYDEAAEFANVHFIAVATPQKQGEFAADLKYVDAVIETLAPRLTAPAVVFGKSTVPVGTAAQLGARARKLAPVGDAVEVAWNPEFLREGYAVQDTLHPDRIVLGVDKNRPGHAEEVARDVYGILLEEEIPFLVTDLETSELVKTSARTLAAPLLLSLHAASASGPRNTGARDLLQLAQPGLIWRAAVTAEPRVGRRCLHQSADGRLLSPAQTNPPRQELLPCLHRAERRRGFVHPRGAFGSESQTLQAQEARSYQAGPIGATCPGAGRRRRRMGGAVRCSCNWKQKVGKVAKAPQWCAVRPTRRISATSYQGASSAGKLMMLGLFLDGKPLALQCNLLSGTGSFAFKTAFAEDYATSSPGTLLELVNIELLHSSSGAKWMDSCAVAEHPVLNRLWMERRLILNQYVATGCASGDLLVSLTQLGRWVKRLVRPPRGSERRADMTTRSQDAARVQDGLVQHPQRTEGHGR